MSILVCVQGRISMFKYGRISKYVYGMLDFATKRLILFYFQNYYQNMHTRIRKFGKNDNDEQAIQKQLTSDFEVHEFLKSKQESTNISQYARLLNSLIVKRCHKQQQVGRMQVTHSLSPQKSSQIDDGQGRISEELQQRTSQQVEVGRNLQRQIVEIKKSLTFMKGDIDHLVGRDESTKLLASKIVKVKIVAEDQLKRVGLALTKDRQEIKIRNQMQKKFSKKLKNVSSYESGSLARMKKQYAQNVLRKQDIFQRLINTQKMSQNFSQIGSLKAAEKQKTAQNQQALLFLRKLARAANEFRSQPHSLDLFKLFKTFFEQCSQFENEKQGLIAHCVEDILGKYYYLKERIKQQTGDYNQLVQLRQQLKNKWEKMLQQQNQWLQRLNSEQIQKYLISKEARLSYSVLIKSFKEQLKKIFTVLSYLQKGQIQQKQPSLLTRILGGRQSQRHNYITCLHKMHSLLACPFSSSQQEELISCPHTQYERFYQDLLSDVKKWLQKVKIRYNEQRIQSIFSPKNIKLRNSCIGTVSRVSHVKKDSQSVSNDILKENQHAEEQQYVDGDNGVTVGRNCYSSAHFQSKKSVVKAKRINFLQTIDKDYYKMLKSTIKMEKENTRKNYQFQRNFKRTKYVSRDNILEQKRFEASFSVLVTKPTQTGRTEERLKTANGFLSTQTGNQQSFYIEKEKGLSGQITPKTGWLRKRGEVKDYKSRFADKLQLALTYA